MIKSFKTLLEEIQEEQELNEAPKNLPPPEEDDEDEDLEGDLPPEDDDEDGDKEDEPSAKDLADGKGHYSADDLREIIDYVYDVLEKEQDDDEDEETGEKKKKDDVGEIGLDLIYEYADLLPETVINQVVDDLKDIFEIEDTMLESIVTEGSAFFSKSKKGSAAKAASKLMRAYYRKNKSKILKRNKSWRNSPMGKKITALHKKIFKGMGKVHGKRVVHQL